MDKTYVRILVALGSLVLLYLSIVLVASITQLADAADRVYQGMGQPVFWVLMAMFLFFLISPFYLYFKLPKALIPPAETTGPKHDEYLAQVRKRLSSNIRLKDVPVDSHSDIEAAMVILSKGADKVIREIAGAVFVSTAIMQNGRLDGLITLVTQVRMVWRIACVYQQRPSPRQMVYLYSNVGANALLAESIDDIDLSEIIAPMLSSSMASAIPGASLIVNSITNGAANAFLTLRVGIIARQYCEPLSTPKRRVVRRYATLSAIAMVGNIVKENSSSIPSEFWSILKGKTKNAVDSTMQGAISVTGKVTNSVAKGARTFKSAVDTTVDGTTNLAKQLYSRKNDPEK
jgi:hypothetical protein